ncbi:hypothetical protein [Lactobacillus delbrueckii]|uniref:hypothetical protein n=1 Tax=Lactobacillus delbrueckii TaxID=1584 RepID=UPI0021A793AD|nr:hypothetical protein [Lactobacillus delbrueckii]
MWSSPRRLPALPDCHLVKAYQEVTPAKSLALKFTGDFSTVKTQGKQKSRNQCSFECV